MRVRWTTDAADDLERICDDIAESRPESARRVAQSVVERISELQTFPRIGRPGRVVGTREIAFHRSRMSLFTKSLIVKTRCESCVSCMARSSGRRRKGDTALTPPAAGLVMFHFSADLTITPLGDRN